MSEKVKLPKDVCDALDLMTEFYKYPESKIVSYIFRKSFDVDLDKRLLCLNEQDADAIMRALVLGYEPIPDTPEELMKDIWFRHSSDGYLHKTIRECIYLTLKIHEIHYDWLKDDVK